MSAAQQGVQWTGGYAPRFQAFFTALSFLRFDGWFSHQAANASRWAVNSEQ
jgi:hypothetical protein